MKLGAYRQRKPTGVDWLGDIPRHWSVDRLKWSAEGCVNGVWGEEPNDVDDLICVRVADFDRERFQVAASPPTLRAIDSAQRRNRLLKKDDLLIEKSGGGEKQLVGCVVHFQHDFPAVCSNFVARMPVAPGQYPRFWTYLHSAIYGARLNYLAIKQTTGIQNLDTGEYLNLPAPYPPLEEQVAIASFLDIETAQIDTLVAKKRELIAKLKEKRSALIARTVTRGLPPEAAEAAGLEPNPEMKDSGVEWFGAIPSNWNVSQLRHMCRVIDCKHRTVSFVEEGVPLASIKEVHDFEVALQDANMTTDEEYLELIEGDRKPHRGDIIYSRNASVGDAALVTTDKTFCMGQDVCLIRADGHHGRFLAYLFRSHSLRQQVESLVIGSTFRRINVGQIKAFWVCLPSYDEQKLITAYLDRETSKIDQLATEVETAIARLTEYRQALITAAVTGKIDVRGYDAGKEAA